MNINQIFNEYIIECSSTCKNSTLERYNYVFKLYIAPYFNLKNIENLSVLDINLWKLEINKLKLSYESKKKIFNNFSSILNYAFRVYNIPNILKRCKNFKKDKPNKDILIYTLLDFKKFLNVIDNPEHKLFFALLFYLGLRRGEALALTYKDFKENSIIINKSKRKGVISTPKTIYSFRIVNFPSIIRKLFNDHLIFKKKIPKDNDFVFSLSESTISRYNIIYSKKASLHTIRIHDFRHSNISFLCSIGVSYSAVAKRVGHKNIKEIIDTYLHCNNSELEIANSLLETIIKD